MVECLTRDGGVVGQASPEVLHCVHRQDTLSPALLVQPLEDPFRHDRKIVDWDVNNQHKQNQYYLDTDDVKDIYFCPIEIISGLTDKGQFQYLTKLKWPQEGTNLYTTQYLSLR